LRQKFEHKIHDHRKMRPANGGNRHWLISDRKINLLAMPYQIFRAKNRHFSKKMPTNCHIGMIIAALLTEQ